jgi:hypothetical protein
MKNGTITILNLSYGAVFILEESEVIACNYFKAENFEKIWEYNYHV